MFNVIEMWPKYSNCTICWKETQLGYWLPMYEGEVVDIKKTEEWAGMPVCKECYEKENGDEKW